MALLKLNMAIDKRKRKEVNAAVQEIAAVRNRIRSNRIDGNRENELADCKEISMMIGEKAEKMGVQTDFTHRLETFDTDLLVAQAMPAKENGEWMIPRHTKKENEQRLEIEHLRSGKFGAYLLNGTSAEDGTEKRISGSRYSKLSPEEQKKYKKLGAYPNSMNLKIQKLQEQGKFGAALELAALSGVFVDGIKIDKDYPIQGEIPKTEHGRQRNVRIGLHRRRSQVTHQHNDRFVRV